MDLVCIILASKKERGCYAPCRGFCWLGYSQIAGGMSWCLVVSRCLVLPWDCMTSARFAMDEPRGGHTPSSTFVKQSKLKRWKCLKFEWLDFVLPLKYVIACSSKLNDYDISCCLGCGLGRSNGSWGIFKRPKPGLLPGRFTILTNGKQDSGPEHSVQRSCFPCTHVSHLPESHEPRVSVGTSPQGNRSAFRRSVALADFNLMATSGVLLPLEFLLLL